MLRSCRILLYGVCFLLAGCRSGVSTLDIPVVEPFDLSRYLGVWYEAARLPQWFERGLESVTAEYYRAPDGSIRVRNTGYRAGAKTVANGYVRQVRPGAGALEVSFFRPFYGAYRIIALTPDYSAALVTSSTRDSAWVLVRDPDRAIKVLPKYVAMLKLWGYDCSRLEYPVMAVKTPASAAPR